jgi:hypothetical protein
MLVVPADGNSERKVFEAGSYIILRLFGVNIPQEKSSNRNGTLCLFPEELVGYREMVSCELTSE